MAGKPISFWLNEKEIKKLEILKSKAKKEKRSTSNYIKKRIFG